MKIPLIKCNLFPCEGVYRGKPGQHPRRAHTKKRGLVAPNPKPIECKVWFEGATDDGEGNLCHPDGNEVFYMDFEAPTNVNIGPGRYLQFWSHFDIENVFAHIVESEEEQTPEWHSIALATTDRERFKIRPGYGGPEISVTTHVWDIDSETIHDRYLITVAVENFQTTWDKIAEAMPHYDQWGWLHFGEWLTCFFPEKTALLQEAERLCYLMQSRKKLKGSWQPRIEYHGGLVTGSWWEIPTTNWNYEPIDDYFLLYAKEKTVHISHESLGRVYRVFKTARAAQEYVKKVRRAAPIHWSFFRPCEDGFSYE